MRMISDHYKLPGQYRQQKTHFVPNSFSNLHHFLKMSKFVHCSWSRDQNMIFKIMNYLFLNTNFALKLQGKC